MNGGGAASIDDYKIILIYPSNIVAVYDAESAEIQQVI